MSEYLADRAHLLMAGVTGSRTRYGGKTAWATWWADNWARDAFDVILFYNPKGDRSPERYGDAVVPTADRAAQALGNDGAQWVTVTPDHQDWELEHERLRELVHWLGDSLGAGAEIAVVHDEAPEYDGDSLQGFVRVDGNGSRCKSVVVAQSPGDLSKRVRGQCILCWIGPVTGEEQGIFRANNRGAHFDWIQGAQGPYQWSVLTGPDPSDRDTYEPVPERYAD